MSDNFSYFIAAGRSLEQANAWDASITAGLKASKAWGKELGAIEVSFDVRWGVNGMKFPAGKAPKGWCKDSRQRDWSVPSGSRSKESKAVRDRVETIKPTSTPGNDWIEGNRWYSSSLEKVGDKWVIGQHEKCKDLPEDAIPIKRSEYWALKEQKESAD